MGDYNFIDCIDCATLSRQPGRSGVGFRFRRSVKIIPGLRLNLSRSGASVSVGTRGFHYTVGPKGTRVTAGIPGTGLSWTEYTPHKNQRNSSDTANPNFVLEPISETPNFPAISNETNLTTIESAPAAQINALSTSELAPILNSAHDRLRLAPFVFVACSVLFALAFNSGSQFSLSLAALYSSIFIPVSIFLDRYRRSVKIAYKLDHTANIVAEALADTFSDLRACNSIWAVRAEGATSDWKRNAGATKLSERQRIYPKLDRPSCIRGSVTFPALKVGTQELYFLPDAVLAMTRGSIAALHYQDLVTSSCSVRFIESENVPGDTSVVGETWRFVNKKGGPDRRFNFNKRLPICEYGEIDFKSESGLNCKIQFSNPSAIKRFSKAIDILHRPESLLHSKPITSYQKAKHWPTIACSCCLIFGGIILAALSFEPIGLTAPAPDSRSSNLVTNSISKTSGQATASSRQTNQIADRKPQFENYNKMPLIITPVLAPEAAAPTKRLPTLFNVPLPRPRP